MWFCETLNLDKFIAPKGPSQQSLKGDCSDHCHWNSYRSQISERLFQCNWWEYFSSGNGWIIPENHLRISKKLTDSKENFQCDFNVILWVFETEFIAPKEHQSTKPQRGLFRPLPLEAIFQTGHQLISYSNVIGESISHQVMAELFLKITWKSATLDWANKRLCWTTLFGLDNCLGMAVALITQWLTCQETEWV